MVLQSVERRWTYFISSDRSLFRTHKIRYSFFRSAILGMLDDLNRGTLLTYKADRGLAVDLAAISEKIRDLEKLRARYLRVIEGNETLDDPIIERYRESTRALAELKASREALQNRVDPVDQRYPEDLGAIPRIVVENANRDARVRNTSSGSATRSVNGSRASSLPSARLSSPLPGRKLPGFRSGRIKSSPR
jgi:hypothetical protein